MFVPKGHALAGTLIAISERGLDASGNLLAFLIGGPSPGGFTVKRIDDYTWAATLRRTAKVVATTENVVSKDGKTMTTTTNGTSVSFWEKQ